MRIGWKAAVHDPAVASFRFRVLEPLRALVARGHAVELFRAERAADYDLVVFCKSYRPADAEIARSVRARGGRVLLDLCDNHFFNPYHLPRYARAREELLAMIALSDRVVVSTPALAQVVQAEAGLDRLPEVVGDAVEALAMPPRDETGPRQLLWFGSHGSPNAPSGMMDLLRIAEPLRAQAARTPFELVVASNDAAKFDRMAPELGVPARYLPWTADMFPALLAAASGVVIPLSDNPFVACKTHNRLSTALWAGVPVVADAIESYREFAEFAWLDDWAAGLRAVLEQPERARERAAGARAYLQRHWTMETLAPQWEQALGLTARGSTDASLAVSSERPRGPARPPIYQAALDPVGEAVLTGWARVIAHPPRPVIVTLEQDGVTLAEAVATGARPDLSAVGFKDSGCGFELVVPAAWRDGRPRRFSVVADGVHVVETLSARFAPDVAAPAVPDPSRPGRARGTDPARVKEDVRLQKRLADELERLDQAMEQVRSIAARIIVAASGGDRAGRPLAIRDPCSDEPEDRPG